MTNLCNVDGRIRPEADAMVPVLDRGFLFGDSVYEVVRTHKGRLLCLADHLQRLRHSAARILLEVPLSDAGFEERINETIRAAGNPDSYVRIMVTRGMASRPDIDPDYTIGGPTVILLVRPLPPKPPRLLAEGIQAALVATRRNDPRALDPAIKSGNYLNNILGLMEAKRTGADTALFLNVAGCLTEAPTANVWLVKAGRTRTPPLSAGILAGITRELLLRVCRRDGVPIEEIDLTPQDLREADEVFLSSTTRDLTPITRLDGAPVGSGRPGPVTLELASRLERYCDELVGH